MTNTLFDDILRIPMAQEPLHDLLSANISSGGGAATNNHQYNHKHTIKRSSTKRRKHKHRGHTKRIR